MTNKLALMAASMALMAGAPPARRDGVFELADPGDPFAGIPFADIVDPRFNHLLGYREPVIVGRGHKRTHVAVPNPKAERQKMLKVRAMQERKAAKRAQTHKRQP